jgi:hypothetical protein
MGLENRILANLATQQASVMTRRRWWWAFGVAAAMAAVGMIVWLGGINHVKSADNIAHKTTTAAQKTATANGQFEVKRPMAEAAIQRRARPRSAKTIEAAAVPRLSEFPSPRPLSQQELLFAGYAKHFPREATLIAQEHDKFEKEIQQAQQEAENGLAVSNQER